MKILDQLEQVIEQLVEGGSGRLFRTPVRPTVIARRIEDAMAAGTEINRDLIVAPNDLQVHMHPADVARLSSYLTSLVQQLEYGAVQFARQSGWTLLNPARAEIVAAPGVAQGDARVEATIRATIGADIPFTRLPISGEFRLLVANGAQIGQAFVVRRGSTIIGRDQECDITLVGDDVSRQHARIDVSSRGVVVTDLQSTNGTRRNGKAIVRTNITPGDTVRFGTVSTRFLVPGLPQFDISP